MQIYKINSDNVSIKSDKYGMRAYTNSTRGRAQLEAECPAEIVQAVYKVWGDTPTVTEPTLPEPPAPGPSETDKLKQQLAYVQSALAALQASK